MTIRMSDVTPEDDLLEDDDIEMHPLDLLFAAQSAEPKPAGWPECEFEDCSDPVSFKMTDRFGKVHRACTDHQETLDQWVREHNGWDAPVGAGVVETDGGGEGRTEDGSG